MSSKVITNRAQFQRLIELLQDKPEIAQGYTKAPKEEVNAFWEQVKTELNSLGPPTKDASSWRKVWLDWKAYIKRKLSGNKKECNATGGGVNKMHSFSNLEEDVIRLAGLETSTGGIKGTHSFGIGITSSAELLSSTREVNGVAHTEESQVADASMSSDVVDLRSVPRRVLLTLRQSYDATSLLKDQSNIQKDFYQKTELFWGKQEKTYDEISSNLRQINRGIENLCDIQKQIFEETKRHNKIKENFWSAKKLKLSKDEI